MAFSGWHKVFTAEFCKQLANDADQRYRRMVETDRQMWEEFAKHCIERDTLKAAWQVPSWTRVFRGAGE